LKHGALRGGARLEVDALRLRQLAVRRQARGVRRATRRERSHGRERRRSAERGDERRRGRAPAALLQRQQRRYVRFSNGRQAAEPQARRR
jgi:hypothetical protein